MRVGGTQRVTLWANYSDGTKRDVTDEATWSSTDRSIATVDAGRITGQRRGRCGIVVYYGGHDVVVTVWVKSWGFF